MVFKRKRKTRGMPYPQCSKQACTRPIRKVRKNRDCEIYNASRWFTAFGLESIVIFFKKPIIMPGYFFKDNTCS